MKKVFIIFIILSHISPLILCAQTIDNSRSKVEFTIGSFGFLSVDGTFTGMDGKVNFNPQNLSGSGFDVCIQSATISTGIKMRDDHLRSDDFLDVEKYPNICFKSMGITSHNGNYKVRGNLSLHGVTKEVEIPFTYKNKTLEGTFTIDRSNYKVGEDTGRFTVGKEVEIKIICILQ